ncbi:MAG: hypothetical protein ACQEQ6_03920, partial [Pseudomonadota bacterium]
RKLSRVKSDREKRATRTILVLHLVAFITTLFLHSFLTTLLCIIAKERATGCFQAQTVINEAQIAQTARS